jgi:hypothetical protein
MSFVQLMQAARGGARVLRNSDHVAPELKAALLSEVIDCWRRMAQVISLLIPAIAKYSAAAFEGMGFFLDEPFDDNVGDADRRLILLTSMLDNIVAWHQEDLFSKRIAPLLNDYMEKNRGSVGEAMVVLMLTQQRPPGWDGIVEGFITRVDKNSLYLYRVFHSLCREFKISFSTERTRQQLRRLAAMAVAKHETGQRRPGTHLVEKVAQELERRIMNPRRTEGASKDGPLFPPGMQIPDVGK